MNPSIDASVDVISTAKCSSITRCLADCCFSFCGIKDWCGEFRSSVSHDSYRSRSLSRSIDASLTVVYSAVSGLVLKRNLSQRKANLSTITMHVNAIVAFACIRW